MMHPYFTKYAKENDMSKGIAPVSAEQLEKVMLAVKEARKSAVTSFTNGENRRLESTPYTTNMEFVRGLLVRQSQLLALRKQTKKVAEQTSLDEAIKTVERLIKNAYATGVKPGDTIENVNARIDKILSSSLSIFDLNDFSQPSHKTTHSPSEEQMPLLSSSSSSGPLAQSQPLTIKQIVNAPGPAAHFPLPSTSSITTPLVPGNGNSSHAQQSTPAHTPKPLNVILHPPPANSPSPAHAPTTATSQGQPSAQASAQASAQPQRTSPAAGGRALSVGGRAISRAIVTQLNDPEFRTALSKLGNYLKVK
jgi:hypothetical protein